MSPTTSHRQVIFTDLRHIRCGDLEWLSPEGEKLRLRGLPEPPVEAHAAMDFVPRGVRLVAQPAEKSERFRNGPTGRVVFEDGLYRSWYLDGRPGPGTYSTADSLSVAICSSESKDGFEWVERSRCEIDARDQSGFEGFTVFVDPNGSSDERYKAVRSGPAPREQWASLWEEYSKVHPRYRDPRLDAEGMYYIYGAVSPDGLHWTAIREPLMIHFSDTDTSVYFDSWLNKYVMYTRHFWQDRRWIGWAEADDFRHWGPLNPLIWPPLDGPLSDDIYTNGRTEYPGLPQHHLMFPMFYHRYSQTSEIHLYSSADGICWNRVPGGPVLTPGKPGEWDSEFIVAGKDLVPFGQDRIGIPYYGTSFPHKYPRWKSVLEATRSSWAWWPKGRLCAVVADEEGEFFTFPLAPAGRELRLNMRTCHAGMVQVGLAGVPGRGVEDCDPMLGDNLAMPVHWKGHPEIGVSQGQEVTLHFKLRAAELFGFEWV